jgi:hypothetical protein
MTGDDAEGVLEAVGAGVRLLVASSIDVYRAYASVMPGVVTDTVPLDEQAPLRTGPPPDRDYVTPGFDYDPARYEKLDVEAAYRARAGTVCRLPMIYGEHDYKHREEFILRRVRADGKHPSRKGNVASVTGRRTGPRRWDAPSLKRFRRHGSCSTRRNSLTSPASAAASPTRGAPSRPTSGQASPATTSWSACRSGSIWPPVPTSRPASTR